MLTLKGLMLTYSSLRKLRRRLWGNSTLTNHISLSAVLPSMKMEKKNMKKVFILLICYHVSCSGKIVFQVFLYKFPLTYTGCVIKPGEFAAFIFSKQARLFLSFGSNKQIWPIRSLHLATSALIAQIQHLYWMCNEIEIIKWILFYIRHTTEHYTGSLGYLKCFLYQLICVNKCSNSAADILKYVQDRPWYSLNSWIKSWNSPRSCLSWELDEPKICFFLLSFRKIGTNSLSLHINFHWYFVVVVF